jgi:hypothetical protein
MGSTSLPKENIWYEFRNGDKATRSANGMWSTEQKPSSKQKVRLFFSEEFGKAENFICDEVWHSNCAIGFGYPFSRNSSREKR